MNNEELIKKLIAKIEDILYQDNKYSDKDMAKLIIEILEDEYDLK